MLPMFELQSVIDTFTAQLTAIISAQATERARSTVLAAFGVNGQGVRRRGRPPKVLQSAVTASPAEIVRKKAPVQLCPVPGCKSPAAPIFGMVCAKHKDVPKAKIRKFREARKAKKLGLEPAKATKRRAKRVTAKATRVSGMRKTPKVAVPSKANGPLASASATT
jgi:hypothetical protein